MFYIYWRILLFIVKCSWVLIMRKYKLDFYDSTNIKSYNLDESMRYQLSMLDSLDVFTRKHSENVANLTCRICEYLHMKSYFTVYCTICAYLHDIGKQFIPPSILQKNRTSYWWRIWNYETTYNSWI